ncbi:MAG TPA: hypothetical protein VGL21_21055, partial [Jatrophihabitantaceae bacterium]
MIFLVWLWLTNIAILLGAEFNAQSERQHLVEAGLPEDVEPFVEPRDTRKLSEPDAERVEEAVRTRRAYLR